MYAFSSPRPLAYDSRHGRRRVPAALPRDAAGGIDPRSVVLAIHDEDGFARRALAAAQPAGAPPEQLRLYGEGELAAWPGFPRRLGRLDGAFAIVADPAPLPAQLAALRAALPGRRHFRIGLVGGFGFNLGDTILGATAWRAALPTLGDVLGGVSADALLGPLASRSAGAIMAAEGGIDRALFVPPSLDAFARYDAFFDFSGLTGLPGFHEGSALDWILWWMGLDPTAVPPGSKRNRLRLPESALTWARGRLAAVPSPRVHLGWRASVPLRSMPDEEMRRLTAELLALVPALTLVTDAPLGLEHPRLLDLGTEADSPERLMALVVCCDGHLGIDSSSAHAADAADVPAVMLAVTLPPGRFPHYPNMCLMNPPGAEALPGWGRTKLDDAAWEGAREGYRRAWAAVSARDCWAALAERMALRPPPGRRNVVLSGPVHHPAQAPSALRSPFPRDVPSRLDLWADEMTRGFADEVLRPGCTAVLLGAQGEVPMALLGRVAPGGALHVVEPRRLRAQALATAAQAAGLDGLHPWPAVAGAAPGRAEVAGFDPLGEADPAAWGNLRDAVAVRALALDGLGLDSCDALLLRPPHDALAALEGAAGPRSPAFSPRTAMRAGCAAPGRGPPPCCSSPRRPRPARGSRASSRCERGRGVGRAEAGAIGGRP